MLIVELVLTAISCQRLADNMMTVKDLIEQLQKYNPDATIDMYSEGENLHFSFGFGGIGIDPKEEDAIFVILYADGNNA